MNYCAWLMVAFVFTSCASVKTTDTSVAKRYTTYGIAKLPDTWKKEPFRGADLFFQNINSDAAIYVHAQCEKFSDSPLEALTAQLLVDMGKYHIISQRRVPLRDREGLVSEVNVDLDGVSRYLKIMVMRKNRCVYDAVLSAQEKRSDIDHDFDQMASGFWAEAAL